MFRLGDLPIRLVHDAGVRRTELSIDVGYPDSLGTFPCSYSLMLMVVGNSGWHIMRLESAALPCTLSP
jgi:hypothetical protein